MNSAGDDDKLLVLDVEHGVGAGDRQDWHVVASQRLERIFLRIFPASVFFFSSQLHESGFIYKRHHLHRFVQIEKY